MHNYPVGLALISSRASTQHLVCTLKRTPKLEVHNVVILSTLPLVIGVSCGLVYGLIYAPVYDRIYGPIYALIYGPVNVSNFT